MPKSNTKKQRRDDRYKSIYRFVKENIGLRQVSLNTIGAYAVRYDKKYLEERKKVIQKINGKNTPPTYKEIKNLIALQEKHPAQKMLFDRNAITSTVSIIDDVFSSVLRFYYEENPGKLSTENQNVSYGELNSLETIEEARHFLIKKEIDKILLRGGPHDRLKILKNELGLVVPDKTEHLNEFYKLIKIRNLIIHNSCKMDNEYLRKFATNEEKDKSSVKIDKDYVSDGLAITLFFCGVILQSAQTKFANKKIESKDYILNDVMHTLLKRHKYSYLEEIYQSIDKFGLDEVTKRMIVVNYCIGLKKQGKSLKKVIQELDKHDWSLAGKDNEFKLCLHALKDEDKDFYQTLETLIKRDIITEQHILDWELFSLYSKKKKYREIIKKQIKHDNI